MSTCRHHDVLHGGGIECKKMLDILSHIDRDAMKSRLREVVAWAETILPEDALMTPDWSSTRNVRRVRDDDPKNEGSEHQNVLSSPLTYQSLQSPAA